MKYISVLFFVLLMITTWSMAHNENTESVLQHKKVEASFEEFVRSAIQNQIPNVKDIVFRQLYTETVRPDEELTAHFRYDVVAPTAGGDVTAKTIEGTVTLKSTDNGQNWTIQDEHISSPQLRFQEGVRISPKDASTEADAPTEADKQSPPGAITDTETKFEENTEKSEHAAAHESGHADTHEAGHSDSHAGKE